MSTKVQIMPVDIAHQIDGVISEMEAKYRELVEAKIERAWQSEANQRTRGFWDWLTREPRTKLLTREAIRDRFSLYGPGEWALLCLDPIVDCLDTSWEVRMPQIAYEHSIRHLCRAAVNYPSKPLLVDAEVLNAFKSYWDAYQERTHAAP